MQKYLDQQKHQRKLVEDTVPEKTLRMAAPNFNGSESHLISTPVSTKTPSKSSEIRSSGQVNETQSAP